MALTDNIVAYWKFDESSGDASDATGNGNTLTNTNTVGYAAAVINNGADFGAANSNKKLSRAGNCGIGTGDYTMTCWVNMSAQPGADTNFQIFNVANATNDVVCRFTYQQNGGLFNMLFQREKPGVGDEKYTHNATFTTGVWYFLAMTFTSSTITPYINASSPGTASASGTGLAVVDQTTFGVLDFLDVQYASCLVDEAGIWTRALSGTEITELYNSGAGLQYPFTAVGATRDARSFSILGVG